MPKNIAGVIYGIICPAWPTVFGPTNCQRDRLEARKWLEQPPTDAPTPAKEYYCTRAR